MIPVIQSSVVIVKLNKKGTYVSLLCYKERNLLTCNGVSNYFQGRFLERFKLATVSPNSYPPPSPSFSSPAFLPASHPASLTAFHPALASIPPHLPPLQPSLLFPSCTLSTLPFCLPSFLTSILPFSLLPGLSSCCPPSTSLIAFTPGHISLCLPSSVPLPYPRLMRFNFLLPNPLITLNGHLLARFISSIILNDGHNQTEIKCNRIRFQLLLDNYVCSINLPLTAGQVQPRKLTNQKPI